MRTLLIAVTIACATLGWIGVQFKWKQDREAALRWLWPIQARQFASARASALPQINGHYLSRVDSPVAWSLHALGVLGVERIDVRESSLSAAEGFSLDELRRLFPEAEVTLAPPPPSN
jgi:hypothetical protein